MRHWCIIVCVTAHEPDALARFVRQSANRTYHYRPIVCYNLRCFLLLLAPPLLTNYPRCCADFTRWWWCCPQAILGLHDVPRARHRVELHTYLRGGLERGKGSAHGRLVVL